MRLHRSPRALRLAVSTAVATLLLGTGSPADGEELFVDRAAELGIDFVHFNGMSGEFYFPEMTGPGGALFDYDNDGDLDLYLAQGAMMGPGKTIPQATIAPEHPLPLRDRLYRNDLETGQDGAPVLKFTDVTAASGIQPGGYGMGVAAGDIDNDGWTDLYVTNFGSNRLYRNRGDGTFEDVTGSSGTDDKRWSVSAAFLDYDRDGWLDLYVGNYVDFSYAVHKVCSTATGARDYCGPLAYSPEPDRLFRNRGDGTFEDVSIKAGLAAAPGSALGVVGADLNGDGLIDLYVGNDEMPNFLWLNQGDGTFLDDALLSGSALNYQGKPEASMGVDAGDFDNDGDEDLFMAHLVGETNTLYVNDGSGVFRDATRMIGLGNPSWNFTAFGTVWLDFDNDGDLDLVTVNGAVKTIEALAQVDDPYPLHQINQLFRNDEGKFTEVTPATGSFTLSEVSRGAASGDVDNDGDVDLLIINNAGPARLVINQSSSDAAWVGLRLVDGSGRDALGARVRLLTADGRNLWRRVRSDGSYASALDPRLTVGLGASGTEVESVLVFWPSGRREAWDEVPLGRYTTLREGAGKETQ